MDSQRACTFITQLAMFWRLTSTSIALRSASMRYSGSAFTYLPFISQDMSDAVANDPGMGPAGWGARTIMPLDSPPAALSSQHAGQR